MDQELQLLTTKQLATYLRKPVNTIRGWRHRKVGPPGFRLGRDTVYRREAVDAWLRGLEASDSKAAVPLPSRAHAAVHAPETTAAPGCPPAPPVEHNTNTASQQIEGAR